MNTNLGLTGGEGNVDEDEIGYSDSGNTMGAGTMTVRKVIK